MFMIYHEYYKRYIFILELKVEKRARSRYTISEINRIQEIVMLEYTLNKTSKSIYL